jgi:hypothetical protein
MTDEPTRPARGGYFARYRQKLEPLIGADAAAAASAYYRWFLGMVGCLLLAVGLAAFMDPGSSAVGLLGVVLAFLAMVGCGIRLVVLSARGGRLAADYLSKRFRHPVRNRGVKVSLHWWQDFVERERTRPT